jgi:hypothetical protein
MVILSDVLFGDAVVEVDCYGVVFFDVGDGVGEEVFGGAAVYGVCAVIQDVVEGVEFAAGAEAPVVLDGDVEVGAVIDGEGSQGGDGVGG